MFSEEDRLLHWEIQRGQIWKEIFHIPIGVQTPSRTRHSSPNDILPMGGISQDMKKQDNKLVMSIKERVVGNQCFMTTRSTNEHVEECARHQENHRVNYSLVTKI